MWNKGMRMQTVLIFTHNSFAFMTFSDGDMTSYDCSGIIPNSMWVLSDMKFLPLRWNRKGWGGGGGGHWRSTVDFWNEPNQRCWNLFEQAGQNKEFEKIMPIQIIKICSSILYFMPVGMKLCCYADWPAIFSITANRYVLNYWGGGFVPYVPDEQPL